MNVVDAQFHNLITDGETPQMLLLVEATSSTSFTGGFYLSLDGDFTTDGASFMDEMTQGEEYALGCVACRTMNVTIANLDGHLNNHNFGWLQAYIGVRRDHNAYTPVSGENCRLAYNRLFYGKTDGFYDNNTLVQSGNCVGLYSLTDGYVYFFMEASGVVSAYRYKLSDSSVETASFGTAMLKKFSNNRGLRINGNGYLYIFEDGWDDTYICTCLGNFEVGRPKKTVTQTIEITDAFDAVHLADIPANYNTFTASNGYYLFNGLVIYCGLSVEYASEVVVNRLKSIPVNVKELMDNAYTVRRLLSFLCEAIGCNARLKPKTKQLYVYTPMSCQEPTEYPITASMVAAGGIEVQEFVTHPIECVAVKSLDNTASLYPVSGSEYTYEYNGNPFVKQASSALLSYVRTMPSFTPMTVEIANADPSFQTGDLVEISLTYGVDENLTDFDEEDITTYDGNDILVVPSIGKWTIPIMSQTLRFNGHCSATYEAKGTEDRSGTTYDNEYIDTNARTKYISSDYIVWGSQFNPKLWALDTDVSLSAQTTTTTSVMSFSLDQGLWVVVGQVSFSAVVSRKVVTISTNPNVYTTTIARNDTDTSVSEKTVLQCTALLDVTASTTYYLNANSSASCSAQASYTRVRAFRIR